MRGPLRARLSLFGDNQPDHWDWLTRKAAKERKSVLKELSVLRKGAFSPWVLLFCCCEELVRISQGLWRRVHLEQDWKRSLDGVTSLSLKEKKFPPSRRRWPGRRNNFSRKLKARLELGCGSIWDQGWGLSCTFLWMRGRLGYPAARSPREEDSMPLPTLTGHEFSWVEPVVIERVSV
jgi:hypothetical protein